MTQTASQELSHHAGLLVLELDLQHADPAGVPPQALSVTAATALIGHLAKDLDRIFEGIDHLGLIAVGALYDQTEILRPGLPMVNTLSELYCGSLRSTDFSPQLIALGTHDGRFPVSAINPQCRPGSGPLLLLPFCFVGQRDDINQLARAMEDSLLQNGEASTATREAVQEAFGVVASNLSYATISDLCALLRVQLENNKLLPLWELLEHAWTERKTVRSIQLDGGNRFLVADDHAHTLFYTFDDWAQFGSGRNQPEADLSAGYLRWSYTQRQYSLALAAYGLHVRWVLASPALEKILETATGEAALKAVREIPCLSGEYLVESIFRNDNERSEQRILITNQADPELGTLAYTVQTFDADHELLRLEHYYPLRPQGLQAIIDQLIERCESQGAERQVFHPGRLLCQESRRSLRPASADDQPAPVKRTH